MDKVKEISGICQSKIIRMGKRIASITISIPDRTRIFISALMFWVYIMYYFSKFFNIVMGFILEYIPDSVIIYKPINSLSRDNLKKHIEDDSITKDTPKRCFPEQHFSEEPHHDIPVKDPRPTIVEARNGDEDMTNKLKAIINMKWDSDINNDGEKTIFGGLNISDMIDVFPKLSTAVIWISYLFEVDKKLSDMNDDELGKNIKYMLISFSDKAIYRTPNLEKKEKAMFGEVPF
jgi:hypothetical protein